MRWTVIALLGLVAGCGGAETPPSETASATVDHEAAAPAPFPRAVEADALPLARGFYVSDDTACGAASNATLGLLRRTGWNGSQYVCNFTRIEQNGDASFRVSEACTDIRAGDEWTSTREWTISETDAVRFKAEDGSEVGYRHCPQTSLPDDWRDNDISDIIAQ